MDNDLHIPMTTEHKAVIVEATSDEAEGMAVWAREILLRAAKEHIAQRQWKVRSDAEFVSRFRALVVDWKQGRRSISTAKQMAEHSAYRQIIEMGSAAVPLIMEEMEKEPDHWFIALHATTGQNPVPEQSRGKITEMTKAWVDWWKGIRAVFESASHSWLPYAGMFKDDPDLQEVVEIIAENRRKMDEDPSVL